MKRETLEETGLHVEPGRVVYLREFIEPEAKRHHCELFFLCRVLSGTLTTANTAGKPDEVWVKEVRFLSRDEIARITVYPEVLKGEFWDDLAGGFPYTKYLGVQRGRVDRLG